MKKDASSTRVRNKMPSGAYLMLDRRRSSSGWPAPRSPGIRRVALYSRSMRSNTTLAPHESYVYLKSLSARKASAVIRCARFKHPNIIYSIHSATSQFTSGGDETRSVVRKASALEGGAARHGTSEESERKFKPKSNPVDSHPHGRSIKSISIDGNRLPDRDSLGLARGNNLFTDGPPFGKLQ
ncbi:hypothetical protein EYF80_006567 [Liparis tanakae]|uniref:Uncharacterized protein n=1 Tax=Liparis tanakae TaxID=230148 RepID=A0A4Z2J084_9TELE|nr:hypothetical protein EYF80_006567 [Liparis tanakae]